MLEFAGFHAGLCRALVTQMSVFVVPLAENTKPPPSPSPGGGSVDATAGLLTGRDGRHGAVAMGLELASQRHPLVLVVRIVCGETPSPDLELS